MKIWTSEHVFNHSWETITHAACRKYPNPINPNIVSIDVVDRKVINGVLTTHRLIGSLFGIPSWIQTIVPLANRLMFCREYSEINPENKTMTLKSWNLSLTSNVAVEEKLVYMPHPNNPEGATLLKQEAVVTVFGSPLSNYVEKWLTSTISRNANKVYKVNYYALYHTFKGRQAIEWVVGCINAEVHELTNCATDSLIQSRKSFDEFTLTAKRSFDDAARKSIDLLEDIHQITNTTNL